MSSKCIYHTNDYLCSFCDPNIPKLTAGSSPTIVSKTNKDHYESSSWQQATHGESVKDPFSYLGISDLAEVSKQINMLRLTVVGICSKQYNSFPPNTGTELMEQAASTSASFAKLLEALEDLRSLAETVLKTSNGSAPPKASTTFTPFSKP
jgi:hypothetical protein